MDGRAAGTMLAGAVAVAVPSAALAAPLGNAGFGFGGGIALAFVISILAYGFRMYLMMRGAMDITRSLRGKRGLGGTIEPDDFEERVAAKLREMHGGREPVEPVAAPRPVQAQPAPVAQAAPPAPMPVRAGGFGRRQVRDATLSGRSLPNTR